MVFFIISCLLVSVLVFLFKLGEGKKSPSLYGKLCVSIGKKLVVKVDKCLSYEVSVWNSFLSPIFHVYSFLSRKQLLLSYH